MLRRRTMLGPVTWLFQTPVWTTRPRQGTSAGMPTLIDKRGAGTVLPSIRLLPEQLLATFDVVGRARHRRVAHQMHRKGRHVVRPDHASDRQRGAQLLAPCLELVTEHRGGERCVHEAGSD